MNKIIQCCIFATTSVLLAACAENPQLVKNGAPVVTPAPKSHDHMRRPRNPDQFHILMGLNCTGQDVKDWQQFLIENRMPPANMITPDGQFKQTTQTATAIFQGTAHVQTTNTGRVDTNTYKAAVNYTGTGHYPLTNTTPISSNCPPTLARKKPGKKNPQ